MLVQGYDTDDAEEESGSERGAGVDAGTRAAAEGSSDDDSDTESVDSATRRSREAAARVQDFGDAQAGHAPSSSLPAADDLLGHVQRPGFLDPAATRQRNICEAHLNQSARAAAAAQAEAAAKQREDFDVSKLAPRLKRDARDQDKGKVVLSGSAKRAKVDADPTTSQLYSNEALVAMMGGNAQEPRPAAKSTKAMQVEDFLANGLGSAQLPRRKQERKDKEKSKRALGQSSVHGWKTEAEMVLRQQYD